MKNKLKLTKEAKEKAIEDIKNFFLNERDEVIGNLASSILLDFIIEKIASAFYNQGLEDAISFMKERVEDMYGLQIVE